MCGNSDILALIDYFTNGADLSDRDWENYNFYDLWNALENGETPPIRVVCSTLSIPEILSITKAVLGDFTNPSDFIGSNIDLYQLYLLAIGQEEASPTFGNYCIYSLYQVFSVGLTAKFRQAQDFKITLNKAAYLPNVTYNQSQSFDALISKSANVGSVIFNQPQLLTAELAGSFLGLLDEYPGAAVAYSIRLLNSEYSGALVEIRKSGDNELKSFYPDENNELSLNSTDGAGNTLLDWIGIENGFVRTWYDQSGNSNNATMTTVANQLQLITAGIINTENAKPSLNTESTGGQFITTNYPLPLEFSLFATSKSNLSGTYATLCGSDDSFNDWIWEIFRNNKFQLRPDNGSYYLGADLTAIQNLVSTHYNGTVNGDLNAYYNGVSYISESSVSMPAPVGNLQICCAASKPAYMFRGNIQEFIIYPSDQEGNRLGIEGDINDYFSIY